MRRDTEQGIDDVQARLRLVVGRDRVLEVEHDDVGAQGRRLLEHPHVAAGDGQLAAVQAGRLVGHRTLLANPGRLPCRLAVERSRCPMASRFSGIRYRPREHSIHRANPW
jgi:hypothetical protein